jgi:hypothetical protein
MRGTSSACPRRRGQVVQDDVLLLARVVPRDQADRALGRAQVERLMRDSRWNEEEIPCFGDDRVLETPPLPRLDPTLQLVDRRLESVVEVRLR